MKNLFKKILPYILSFDILVLSFFSCSISVYAKDFMPTDIIAGIEYGIEYNDWEPFYRFLYESSDGLMYMFSQMGAFVTKDFVTWVDNNKKLASLANTVPVNQSLTDTKGNKVTFSKEFMAELKAILDEYIKTEQTKEENGGFIILPTTSISDVPADRFKNAQQFRTFRNIIVEKGCLAVQVKFEEEIMFVDPFSDPDHPIMLVGVTSDLNRYENYSYMPVTTKFFCGSDWNIHGYCVKVFPENNVIYTSVSDAVDYISPTTQKTLYQNEAFVNWSFEKHGSMGEYFTLYSVTGENVRVYVSKLAAKNYSVGNRKIYLTENYYNYVPEDLEVSIDDLQKSVDDLQKIIDELLKRIKDDTSEKEIMDLLRQILDALKNQQGTGGGGSGGGDVTVNVDLTETNGWLSKIYTKLSQVFDKISSISIPSMRDVVTAIEDLEKMLKRYLSEITGDLDDIKGQLEEMSEQEFEQKTGDFLDDTMAEFSDIGEKAKTKFPFSIPNDIKLLISKMSVPPPGDAGGGESGVYSVNMMSADDPGGGLITVAEGDPEDAPVISDTGAPIFYLPFVIESAGINEFVVIDLSGFESVSKFCRGLLTIWFILCLYNMTFKVLGLWGDLVD